MTFCHIQNPSCQWCQAGGSAAPRIASCRDGFLARPRATHTGAGIPERLCRRLHAHFTDFRTLSGPLSSSRTACSAAVTHRAPTWGTRGQTPLSHPTKFSFLYLSFLLCFLPASAGRCGAVASVCRPTPLMIASCSKTGFPARLRTAPSFDTPAVRCRYLLPPAGGTKGAIFCDTT